MRCFVTALGTFALLTSAALPALADCIPGTGLCASAGASLGIPFPGVQANGQITLGWNMPGRQWPTERLALVIDRNANHRCDDGDLAATVRLDGRTDVTGLAWAQGPAIAGVCQSLSLGASRE